MKTLSTLWTIFWNSPKLFAFIMQIVKFYGSEQFQEVLTAIGNLLRQLAPPAPTADSAGTIPANPEQEQRRRLLRLRDRLNIAGRITDRDVQTICETFQINPQEQEMWNA